MAELTREELIAICEAAIVPESKWCDRDSESAHRQVGECWALLRAGCPFRISAVGSLCTNEKTIWLYVDSRGFDSFETGGERNTQSFYLPTRKRLADREGRDWY